MLDNATKYTSDGGAVPLTVDNDGDWVIIGVQDGGIGVSTKLQPRIFDLFTQATRTPDRSQGGLGIGLALIKTIVKLHGGEVIVSSDGLGTGRFTVVQPILRLDQTR